MNIPYASHPNAEYVITTDINEMDIVAIHDFLSNEAYWCLGIPFETVETGWNNSLTFGLMNGSKQIGGARVVTDHATFGYLADVYLLSDYRGEGLGEWLMREVMKHPTLTRLRRLMLATSDMHSLYTKFGFESPRKPEILMEITQPNIYSRK